jgi:hypothetical protein
MGIMNTKLPSTKPFYASRTKERGNALIYVLIAIALFAALSFTLGRQMQGSGDSAMTEDRAELYATQIIAYAAQAKSAIDQMKFSGTQIASLNLTRPGAAGFETGSPIHKLYHPQGGGLAPGRLPEGATSQTNNDPPAGWYLGMFNNVEWSRTGAADVILTAHQIDALICGIINEKITGSRTIPTLSGAEIKEILIDEDEYSAGTNSDFTTDASGTPVCAECDKKASLCVRGSGQNNYAFYTVLADR